MEDHTNSFSLISFDLFDVHDVEQIQAFLPAFLVLKIASDVTSQKVLSHLGSVLKNSQGIALGLIREEWKQSSNYFCQRFDLAHTTPQLALIEKGQLSKAWFYDEIISYDFTDEKKQLAAATQGKLEAFQSFRILGALSEMQPSGPLWHQEWLDNFEKHLRLATLAAARRRALEEFIREFRLKFDLPWPACQDEDKASFFEKSQVLYDKWYKSLKHQTLE